MDGGGGVWDQDLRREQGWGWEQGVGGVGTQGGSGGGGESRRWVGPGVGGVRTQGGSGGGGESRGMGGAGSGWGRDSGQERGWGWEQGVCGVGPRGGSGGGVGSRGCVGSALGAGAGVGRRCGSSPSLHAVRPVADSVDAAPQTGAPGGGGRTALWVGVSAGLTVAVLLVALFIYAVRHRRLQRSFTDFASREYTQYDARSGVASLGSVDELGRWPPGGAALARSWTRRRYEPFVR